MTYPSNSETVAQAQLRAFVERILRMKEAAKAINDDIREIYAEAKGNGFDKTVLGQLVSFIEKRAKDPALVAERSAIFDLYLSAYDETGTTIANAHAHEAIEHDADGVITEPAGDSPDHVGARPATGASTDQDPKSQAATITEPAEPVPSGVAADAEAVADSPSLASAPIPEIDASSEAGRSRQEAEKREGPQEPPVDTPPQPSKYNPATHFKSSGGLLRLHGCQEPDACAGSWRELCRSCQKIVEAA